MKNLAKGGVLTSVCFIIAVILAIYAIVKDMSSARMTDMHRQTVQGVKYVGENLKDAAEESEEDK